MCEDVKPDRDELVKADLLKPLGSSTILGGRIIMKNRKLSRMLEIQSGLFIGLLS